MKNVGISVTCTRCMHPCMARQPLLNKEREERGRCWWQTGARRVSSVQGKSGAAFEFAWSHLRDEVKQGYVRGEPSLRAQGQRGKHGFTCKAWALEPDSPEKSSTAPAPSHLNPSKRQGAQVPGIRVVSTWGQLCALDTPWVSSPPRLVCLALEIPIHSPHDGSVSRAELLCLLGLCFAPPGQPRLI